MRDLVDCWAAGAPPRWVKPERVAWLAKRDLTDADGHATVAGRAAILAAGAPVPIGPDPDQALRRLGYRASWTGFRAQVMELSESGLIAYTTVQTQAGPVALPVAVLDFVAVMTAVCCGARVLVGC